MQRLLLFSLPLAAVLMSYHHRAQLIARAHALRLSTNVQTECDVPVDTVALHAMDAALPPLLREYARFHAAGRACVLHPGCVSPPGLLVWDGRPGELYSGAGDRLRAIRITFLLAVMTRRVFLIDWPTSLDAPFDLTVALRPAAVDWTLPRNLSAALRARGVSADRFLWYAARSSSVVAHAARDLRAQQLDVATDDLRAPFHASAVARMSNRLPRGALLLVARNPHAARGLRAFNLTALERVVTRVLFVPAAVTRRAARARGFARDKPFVGVHARTGLDVFEDTDRRHAAVINDLQGVAARLLRCAMRHMRQDQARIFLAADSTRFKRIFADLCRPKGVALKSVWRKVMHGGKHFAKSDHVGNRGSAGMCGAFVDVFADLLVLGRGQVLVSLPSSFAVAAVAGGNVTTWSVIDVDQEESADECAG